MTRLVLVEGLPGSGKTTTARMIEAGARVRGLDARVVGEGDPARHADLDQVANRSPSWPPRRNGPPPGSTS